MHHSILKFTIKNSVLAVVLIAIYYLVQNRFPTLDALLATCTTVFIFLFSVVSYRFLVQNMQKPGNSFVNTFMALMGGKLFLFLAYILVVVLGGEGKVDTNSFLIVFLINYALFTMVEIRDLLTMNDTLATKK